MKIIISVTIIITEWLRLKRTTGGHLVQPACSSRVSGSCYSRLYPDSFLTSPESDTLQPHCETCEKSIWWRVSHKWSLSIIAGKCAGPLQSGNSLDSFFSACLHQCFQERFPLGQFRILGDQSPVGSGLNPFHIIIIMRLHLTFFSYSEIAYLYWCRGDCWFSVSPLLSEWIPLAYPLQSDRESATQRHATLLQHQQAQLRLE